MAFISTQPLPVSRVIYTSSSSGKLTFILTKPLAPLFIGTIVITRTTSGALSSSVTPGADAAHPGKVLLYVDESTFADLRAQAVVPFKVTLSYDDVTLDVVQLELVRDVAAVSQDLVDALVVALRQVLPNSPGPALLADSESRRVYPSAE
jgi:hypothetical protein